MITISRMSRASSVDMQIQHLFVGDEDGLYKITTCMPEALMVAWDICNESVF